MGREGASLNVTLGKHLPYEVDLIWGKRNRFHALVHCPWWTAYLRTRWTGELAVGEVAALARMAVRHSARGYTGRSAQGYPNPEITSASNKSRLFFSDAARLPPMEPCRRVCRQADAAPGRLSSTLIGRH